MITCAQKLADRHLGPFKMLECIGTDAYQLELPAHMQIHSVFNVTLLSPVTPDEIPGQTQPPPPPIIVDDKEEYKVSMILDSAQVCGKLYYLVQ